MLILLFGKPLVFWTGLLTLIFFITQVTSGIIMVKRGNFGLLKYHKLNAIILSLLVAIHLLFAILLYL